MRYYMVTTSDGTILTRSTASRTYTHCVADCRIVRAATPEEIQAAEERRLLWFEPGASKRWIGAWAGSYDLARRQARSYPSHPDGRVTSQVEVLPATEIDRAAYDKARREMQAA